MELGENSHRVVEVELRVALARLDVLRTWTLHLFTIKAHLSLKSQDVLATIPSGVIIIVAPSHTLSIAISLGPQERWPLELEYTPLQLVLESFRLRPKRQTEWSRRRLRSS